MIPDQSLQALFNEALDRVDPAARVRFLDEACGADAALRARLETLLRAHDAAGGFLSQPSRAPSPAQASGPGPIALAATEKAGDRIGRYKLLEQIGEGGCGVVYLAEQEEPVRRQVALKVIKLGMDTRQVVARFEAERQALAMMDHPNIAKVLDAGATETGRPFFVMELVRGVRITEFCDQKRLSPRERLELFVEVCQAIQHAHQKGIIHRDIKPSNILVTINEEVTVPKVIDFGIAKAAQGRLTDQTVFTAFDQFIGTPAYMSPEQALMTSLDIDTRSDIYSLGVLLYELITGRTPIDQKELLAAGLVEMRRTIRGQAPPRPSTRLSTLAPEALRLAALHRRTEPLKLVSLVRGDLDWIIMKCLEKDRARRYETANDLAMDLRRHLDCKPVMARPPSRAYEFQKTVRRHKLAFAAAAAVAVALAIGLGISVWTLGKERQTRQRAVAAERETQQQLYTALLEQAHARVLSRELGQRVGALDAIRRAAAISNSADLRREAFAALAQPDLRFEREFPTGPEVTFVSADPAFERVAIGRGKGAVEIRRLHENQPLTTLPAATNRMAHVATWSADGRFLAVKRDQDYLGEGADMEIWNVTNSQRVLLLTGVAWGCLAFHPQRPWLLVGQGDSGAVMVDLEDGHEVSRFSLVTRPMHLRFSADGTRFAVAGMPANRSRHTLSVQQVETGAILWTNNSNPIIGALNWHPDGRWLAVSDYRGTIALIDAATGELKPLGQHKAEAVTAMFTPDGRFLFSGGWERELICWDLRAMQRIFTIGLDGYEMQIRADGRQCAIRTRSGLQLHALEMPLHRELTEDLGSRLRRATFSPDARWLAASGERHGALWDLTQRGPGAVTRQAANAHLYFSSDGRELFSSSGVRWQITPATNAARAPRLQSLPIRNPPGFSSLCLMSNQVVMISSNGTELIAMDQLDSDTNVWTATRSGSSRVSLDGRWLGIVPPFYPTMYVYKLPGLEPAAHLEHRASGISGFEFAPSGEEVALYSGRGGVEFWSTATWQPTRVLTNFTKIIITPDGSGWWLIKDFRHAWLCEPETLRVLLPLPVDMLPLAISADGRFLAVSIESRRLQLWNLEEVRKQLRSLALDW